MNLFNITISIGLADVQANCRSLEKLYSRAKEVLNQNHEIGVDQIGFWQEEID